MACQVAPRDLSIAMDFLQWQVGRSSSAAVLWVQRQAMAGGEVLEVSTGPASGGQPLIIHRQTTGVLKSACCLSCLECIRHPGNVVACAFQESGWPESAPAVRRSAQR